MAVIQPGTVVGGSHGCMPPFMVMSAIDRDYPKVGEFTRSYTVMAVASGGDQVILVGPLWDDATIVVQP